VCIDTATVILSLARRGPVHYTTYLAEVLYVDQRQYKNCTVTSLKQGWTGVVLGPEQRPGLDNRTLVVVSKCCYELCTDDSFISNQMLVRCTEDRILQTVKYQCGLCGYFSATDNVCFLCFANFHFIE